MEWSRVPAFGAPPNAGACVVRPSAYALIGDERGRIAVVRTKEGVFLPGGGIESGESPVQAIEREVREECALVVRLGTWTARAIEFAWSGLEATHYEKRSTFIEAVVEGPAGCACEPGHELLWLDLGEAASALEHESHAWAVERWAERVAGRRRGSSRDV